MALKRALMFWTHCLAIIALISGCAGTSPCEQVAHEFPEAPPLAAFDHSLHRSVGESHTIVASVLEGRGTQPEFSFQGYLTDQAGLPVPGPISVVIGIAENLNDLPFESTDFPGFTTDGGRFDVRLPVPSPSLMLDSPDLYIAVLDGASLQDLVPRIPLLTVPRAGSAEVARYARTAGSLTDQHLIDIPLSSEWEGGNSDFDLPRAMRIGQMVVLSGFARDLDGDLSPIIATLPFGFRPEKRVVATAILGGAGVNGGEASRIEIYPSGEIVIWYQPSFTPTTIHLGNISFVAAP